MVCTGCGRRNIEAIWRWCPDCGGVLAEDVDLLERLDVPYGDVAVDWVPERVTGDRLATR